MATDWKLIREVMNGAIDACEALDAQAPDLAAGEYGARSDFQPDVSVGDFLTRFWQYPEGAARDIVRLRAAMVRDEKQLSELARALIQTAVACAEAIGLDAEDLAMEHPGFEPHCGSGGTSVESLLRGIPAIQNGWMLTGITKALAEVRQVQES